MGVLVGGGLDGYLEPAGVLGIHGLALGPGPLNAGGIVVHEIHLLFAFHGVRKGGHAHVVLARTAGRMLSKVPMSKLTFKPITLPSALVRSTDQPAGAPLSSLNSLGG